MIKGPFTTRHELENDRYPAVVISWELAETHKSPGAYGPDLWIGDGAIWLTGEEKGKTFHCSLGQSNPLGHIHWELEPHEFGAWASGIFHGHGFTERDFMWAGELCSRLFNAMPEVTP